MHQPTPMSRRSAQTRPASHLQSKHIGLSIVQHAVPDAAPILRSHRCYMVALAEQAASHDTPCTRTRTPYADCCHTSTPFVISYVTRVVLPPFKHTSTVRRRHMRCIHHDSCALPTNAIQGAVHQLPTAKHAAPASANLLGLNQSYLCQHRRACNVVLLQGSAHPQHAAHLSRKKPCAPHQRQLWYLLQQRGPHRTSHQCRMPI